MKTALVTLLSVFLATATLVHAASAPSPYGPVPSARQLKWHQRQMYAFIHFTVNTFTDREWGLGDEPESIFNPTDFDADQVVQTIKQAGLTGVVLTCKHHDGFCLWPSKFTEHSVKNSPWKDGKGDMVREISDACHRHGLAFGTYLSPWDRNHKDYAKPEYITYYRNELRELMTNYGPIFEVWFDGANGGDGYYGGAREKRKIDNRVYYDWSNTWEIVRSLQPDACMFSDGGPDIRWVGNEKGIAGETCWATLNGADFYPGVNGKDVHRNLNEGQRPGTTWMPAEVDVSVRPGWFYHAKEDAKVKTPGQLFDIYLTSVGRGANLILNIPLDRRGKVHEEDAKSLIEWGEGLKATFATNLARGAKLTASNTRGNDPQFAADNLIDQKPDTYWSTDDAVTTADVIFDLGKPTAFNIVKLAEFLPLGQRIDSVELDRDVDGKWQQFASATSIGSQRLIRVEPITTSKVRLRITKAAACPALSEFGLFNAK